MMKRVLTYISVLVLFFSCQKVNQSESFAINFEADSNSELETKAGAGSKVTNTARLKDKEFGLFASIAPDNTSRGFSLFSSSLAEKFSYNVGKWDYSNTLYWDLGKTYRFRAYHPYSGENFSVNESTTDDIFIHYVSGNINQSDLLFAFTKIENTALSDTKVPVNLSFKHALAALEFRIKLKEGLSVTSDKITDFYIQGLHPTASVHYTHNDGDFLSEKIVWNIPEYFEEIDHLYEWTGSKTFTNSGDGTSIFDNDGIVFVIPQTIKEGKTKICFKLASTGDKLVEHYLGSDIWKFGKKYVYTITLTGVSAEISLKIEDWKELNAVYSYTVK